MTITIEYVILAVLIVLIMVITGVVTDHLKGIDRTLKEQLVELRKANERWERP